jgi:general secretion pathway protein A
MFSDYYCIPQQPFGESPDPRFLYYSRAHSGVLSAMLESEARSQRLQALVAAPGLGKTTLMYTLLDRVRHEVDSAFVFYTVWSAGDLLGFLLRELGVSEPGSDIMSRRAALDKALLARAARRRVLVVLDEAQDLDTGALQEIDSLLTRAPRPFHMILAGQPGLRQNLNSIAPASLRDRVAATYEIFPLDVQQTAQYVRHRLKAAGFVGNELFSAGALEMIGMEARGVPRNINMLCSHALDHGAAMRKRIIDRELIEEVVSRFGFMSLDSTAMPNQIRKRSSEADVAHESRQATSEPIRDIDSRESLGDVIRTWLRGHSGMWSGTAGELHRQLLPSFAGRLTTLSIGSAADLARTMESNSAALRETGVSFEIRTSAGQLRRLILRLEELSSRD